MHMMGMCPHSRRVQRTIQISVWVDSSVSSIEAHGLLVEYSAYLLTACHEVVLFVCVIHYGKSTAVRVCTCNRDKISC